MKTENLYKQALAEVPKDVAKEVEYSFELSDKIDRMLREKGLTQKAFAKIVNRSEAEVSSWLSGTHNFTLRTIARISSALNTDLISI